MEHWTTRGEEADSDRRWKSDKEFKSHNGLNGHMESHKHEQRYNFSFCPQRFNTTSHMRYHERKQHKPESVHKNYGHQYLIINPIWDVTKGNNTSLRSLLNMESDSDVPREEKIDRRWKSVFFKFAK